MFSTARACNEIRRVIAGVEGVQRAYSAGEEGPHGIPPALREMPAVLVIPSRTIEYIGRQQGQHRHTYEVLVQVVQDGGDIGRRAATVVPMVDRIIEAFASEVTLGGAVNYCVFRRSEGLQELVYSGQALYGYVLILAVSEQENVTFRTGA